MNCGYKSLQLFSILILILALHSCSKLREERNSITDESLKTGLFQVIKTTPELSTFAGFLAQTGYDKVLELSKNYTIYAPVNTALSSLDPAIVNDPIKLKKFVANHITTQLYSTKEVLLAMRVKMLSGKYLTILQTNVGDAKITVADKYAANGLLQIVDRSLPALDNAWEFLSTNADAPTKQKNFLLSLFRNVFDTSNAVVVGVNPITGDPIYSPGTDSVFTNLFWNRVHDLRNEEKQYSVFMLADAAWDTELQKFAPYYVTNTADSNTLVTSWNVARDFAVDTLYNPASIPDTIISKFGTKLPIDRSAIVKTVKTSNGIVYIMNKMNVLPASKIRTIVVQAENYTGTSNDRRGNTFFRDRVSSLTGLEYRDVLVTGHGVTAFNIRYALPELPSVKYRAYWVAINDIQTAAILQKLTIGTPTSPTFANTSVTANNFSEVLLGEFTMSQYSPLFNIYLVANGTGPIVCDYIKLVPVL